MSYAAYLPVLIQLFLAAVLGATILGVSHIFGQRAKQHSKIKGEAYECGIPSDGAVHTRFSVKFYVTAMLFILFDIEVVFLIPWAFIYREFLASHIPILGPILFFMGLLVLGLFYELRKGALDWEK